MKFLKAVTFLTCMALGFWACQKELNFDGGSLGAFKKDAGGNCLPVVVNGIFQADTVLRLNTNYVDVEVICSVGGTFEIKSDTINGYSFYKSGNVGSGVNTIRLYASGKPLSAGNNIFTIKYGNSTCQFTISVAGSAAGGAIYTLGGSPGSCSGATVGGTYTQGAALGAGNTVTLEVNVTQLGTYTLAAASVNGIIFTSTGLFTTTGIQNVTLSGSGLPLAAGIFNVTATNGTSNCTFSVTVLPAGTGAALFTLNGAPGTCSGATQNGTYAAGTPLIAANTVTVNVSVVTLGTYTITTNSANGMTFGASGTFTVLGPQPVNLSGTGTPSAGGTNNFTATAGISTCIFSVVTTGTPPPPNTDYIPETAGTNYSEALVGGLPSDTSFTKVSANTIVKNGTTYKIFEDLAVGVPTDSVYRRKNGGLYYKLFDQDYGFDSPFNTDGLVLDSNLAVNANWVINLGNNTVGGSPAVGSINTTILAKGATAVIAGNSYTNVIKVEYIYRYNIGGAGNIDYYRWEIWYASGKGIIYEKLNDIPATLTEEYNVTRIQVL